MLILYSLLILMLTLALCILAIPFFKHYRTYFLAYAFIFMLFSVGLYVFSGNHSALQEWLEHGKTHYDLMLEYQELGGLDGIIAKIKERLKAHPDDTQGQAMLKKLYLLKQKKQSE